MAPGGPELGLVRCVVGYGDACRALTCGSIVDPQAKNDHMSKWTGETQPEAPRYFTFLILAGICLSGEVVM
jgi:hypothetical protein